MSMTSMQEEMTDSRTSFVGRKRDLDQLQNQDQVPLRDSSPKDDMHRDNKRVKEYQQLSEDVSIEDEPAINIKPPPSATSSSLPPEPQIETTITPPRRAGAWNKSVQSGLRTSFGNRARTKPLPKPVILSTQHGDADTLSNPVSDSTNIQHAQTSLAIDQDGKDSTMAETTELPEEQASSSVFDQNGSSMPEVQSASTANQDGGDIAMAEILNQPEKQTSSIHGQRERNEHLDLAKRSPPQMESIVSSGDEEGEILTSRGTGDEAGMLHEQNNGTFGQNASAESSLLNGDEDNKDPLQLQEHFFDDSNKGSSAGDAFGANLQLAHSSGRPGSPSYSSSHGPYDVEADSPAKAVSAPSNIATGACKQDQTDDKKAAKQASRSERRAHGRDAREAALVNSYELEDTEPEKDTSQQANTMSGTVKVLNKVQVAKLSEMGKTAYKQAKILRQYAQSENRAGAADAVFANEALSPGAQYSSLQTEKAQGHTGFLQKNPKKEPVYRKSNKDFKLSEVLKDSNPIPIQDFSINVFAPAFLRDNPKDQWHYLSEKEIFAAYNQYLSTYYSHCRDKPAWNSAMDRLIADRTSFSLSEAQLIAKNGSSLPQSMTDTSTRSEKALIAAEEAQRTATDSSAHPQPLSDAPVLSEVTHNLPITEPMEIDIDQVNIHGMERDLQERYFPGTIDRPITYHCLACGDKYHMTLDCPSLTCTSCGGDHAQSICPQTQRCKKCRGRGHRANECPEKLARSQAEAVGCQFCNFTDHLEEGCHFIWRTFNPRLHEIKKVREIPIHCYTCGATGHYGTECGMRKAGRILSGGQTFSRANVMQYVDADNADRAMCAGVDYSIPSRPTKQFNIKGMVNDPIRLDSDDEDVVFIAEKVKKPKRNGRINVAVQRPGQLPQDENSSRRPNPPRQSRPKFSPNVKPNITHRVESGRFGRERTFSPPPRFDDMRYGFAEADDRFRPQAPQQEDFYRPQPQQTQNNYQYTPQSSLPTRPPSMSSGNVPRGGGNSGRGYRGPATRVGAQKKPRKPRKPKGRNQGSG